MLVMASLTAGEATLANVSLTNLLIVSAGNSRLINWDILGIRKSATRSIEVVNGNGMHTTSDRARSPDSSSNAKKQEAHLQGA